MEQKIVSLDATILNTYQSCPLKVKQAFVDLLKPNVKAEALEKGDLFHKLLEVYYSYRFDMMDFRSDTWGELREAKIEPGDLTPEVFCTKVVGPFFASQMNTPPEILEEVIYQFGAYCEFYKHDEWHPLAVEQVGSKILFEDEEWKIIYNIKCDLVAEKGTRIAPWDHKTGSRRSTPNSMSNQFIGTCFVLGMNYMMINKIGFQKTLAPNERFQRFLLNIPQTRIDEWVKNTTWWAKELHKSISEDNWPMNLTACDKYSGCVYIPICESTPEMRLFTISRDFSVGEKWDVAAILEA